MTILITHLTRMTHRFVCAAGIDEADGRHVRPLPPFGRLETDALAANGGLLRLGATIDVGSARPTGRAPEIEDHEVDPSAWRTSRTEPATSFWQRLRARSHASPADIFGSALRARGERSAAVDAGHGAASLGYWMPDSAPQVAAGLRANQGARMHVRDGTRDLNLSLADIRLYTGERLTVNPAAFELLQRRLRETRVILAVGLSRAQSVGPGDPPLHWLQVNNVFFEDDPLWESPQIPDAAREAGA